MATKSILKNIVIKDRKKAENLIKALEISKEQENKMSLEKAIKHGKEHRKQYTDCRAIDTTCRNHGSCIRCQENRLYQSRKEKQKAICKLKEIMDSEFKEENKCQIKNK